jgi:hypothetical protein
VSVTAFAILTLGSGAKPSLVTGRSFNAAGKLSLLLPFINTPYQG